MRIEAFEREAQRLSAKLPQTQRIAVLGSTSFWHPKSASVCAALGARLAEFDAITLLTGGMSGVGTAVALAFQEKKELSGFGGEVIHILPLGHAPLAFGTTHFTGTSLAHRREVLARLASVYIVIEGGPATAEEAAIARGRGAVVIPVGALGGVGSNIYANSRTPILTAQEHWSILGSLTAAPEELACAVIAIARGALGDG